MKVNELEQFEGKLVRITTNTGRVIYGKLERTGVYTFEISGELLLAGSIKSIRPVTEEEYQKWLIKKGIV